MFDYNDYGLPNLADKHPEKVKKLPSDRTFDGRSIGPVIDGTLEEPLHDQLVWDGDEDKWAIRQGDFKLFKNKQGDIELYNLKNDIGESNNIISSNASIAEKLQSDYDKWRSEMGTPMD